MLSASTLIEFEQERAKLNYIPPDGSNSFYQIGNDDIGYSQINILSKTFDEHKRLEIFTDEGTTHTGSGTFDIMGLWSDDGTIYNKLTVIMNTSLVVDETLQISNSNNSVHGTLELAPNSTLIVRGKSTLTFYADSRLIVGDKARIVVEPESHVYIYGNLDIHLSMLDAFFSVRGVEVDSAAVINVGHIGLPDRIYSMTDYEADLRSKVINVYTQGEYNSGLCRIGYSWEAGSPENFSQVISLGVLWGEAILGDFKLSVLGIPEKEISSMQIVSNVFVKKYCTLHITEEYQGHRYIHPELYLGRIIGNNKIPAKCTVNGTIICSGSNAKITVDRGSKLIIESTGVVIITNGANLLSTNNEPEDISLEINGTLYIDTIDQINSFNPENIVFGPKGKLIIRNPDPGSHKLLFTVPNGIESTDLYRLFKNDIDHIEYHISPNTGIGVDEYFEFYGRDLVNWYGGLRFEKAIYDGILVWHDGGFIELYKDITPWATLDASLLQASRLFKGYGSDDKEKLQDVVERLRYAGCGNIIFRFCDGSRHSDVQLTLNDVQMKSVINTPMTSIYDLDVQGDGELFIKNRVPETDMKHIIKDDAMQIALQDGHNKFELG